MTSCFPVYAVASASQSGGGGGGSPVGSVPINNLNEWKAEQTDNILSMMKTAIDWLLDILDRAFNNMALTIASFAVWILMLTEHLLEITFADAVKKVGEGIKAVAKVFKASQDLPMGWIDVGLSAPTFQDDTMDGTTPHLAKNTHGALTKVKGFFTDMTDDIGKYIEQGGEFLNDASDQLWDTKEIGFAAASLGAMLGEFASLIDHTFGRIDETVAAAEKSIADVEAKYAEQLAQAVAEKTGAEQFNAEIQDAVYSKELPSSDIISSKTDIKIGLDGFSGQGMAFV
jgi:hypothetical protein